MPTDTAIRGRVALLKPEISPVQAFVALRSRVGSPNASQKGDKIQWGWYFSYGEYYIYVYDFKLTSISIAVYRDDARGIASTGAASEHARGVAEAFADLLRRQNPNLKPIHQKATRACARH